MHTVKLSIVHHRVV